MTTVIALVLLHLLALVTTNNCFCNRSTYLGCIKSERQALLRFKQDLKDPSHRLASWIGDGDCCKWHGVTCDNFTGNVLKLNLRNPLNGILYDDIDVTVVYESSKLVGKISPSLVDLKHLIYLDLSANSFSHIPKFLGSLRNLRYLNLSRNGFHDTIPRQLGNLSNLQYLDLCCNSLQPSIVHELTNLISLRHLDLSENHIFSSIPNWLHNLTNLEYLSLSGNLSRSTISRSFGRLCNLRSISLTDFGLSQEISKILDILLVCISDKLESLDLSYNQISGHLTHQLRQYQNLGSLILRDNSISGSIPSFFGNFSSFRIIDLSRNNLNGSIPASTGNCVSLEVLDLSDNKLSGPIPLFLGNFSSFRILDLSYNELNGSIPAFIGDWVSLEVFDLSNNKLSGPIPLFLGNFSSFRSFKVFSNELNGSIPSSLGELSSLEDLNLGENKLNGHIPLSLGKLSSLTDLVLSRNKLNGTLSQVHFAGLTELSYFDASDNSLMLKVNQDWIPPFQLVELGLSNCHLGPRFPSWIRSLKELEYLDLSQAGIIDTIPSWFWKSSFPQLLLVNLSHNQIYGEIPDSTEAKYWSSLDLSSNNLSGQLPSMSFKITRLVLSNNAFSGSLFQYLCHGNETNRMEFLIIKNNSLSGELPDCWLKWPFLRVLNLNDNKFVGELPMSMGTSALRSLHLRNNNFCGQIPTTLKSSKRLRVLDLSENEFTGNVPTWMGKTFSKMMILGLRSNKFHGHLPKQICKLTSLQILDLANNNFSGAIPRCISNFRAMVEVDYPARNDIIEATDTFVSHEDALLMMKGVVMEYRETLNLLRVIDLSNNNFSGKIPMEVTDLKALQSLNLSHNFFIGKIPDRIGVMTWLESVDFSMNQLSGEIPGSISNLSFLSHLNLSDNNLIGKIPLGTQIQSFDASCFFGNELCGLPLLTACTKSQVVIDSAPGGGKDDNKHEVDWFYVSMALGFVVGFWSFIGSLLVNRRWRCKYLSFLESPWRQIYL